jgi:hypothetical protein
MSNSQKVRIASAFGTLVLLVGSGCQELPSDGTSTVSQDTSAVSSGQGQQTQFGLSVYATDSANQAIRPALFDDANSSTAIQLTAGKKYIFALTSNSSRAQFVLNSTNIDLPNAPASAPVALTVGQNLITAPAAGDYAFKVAVAGSGQGAGKTYQANASCQNPTFSASDLTPANITVAAGSGTNLYSFSAKNVVTGAGGMGPYLCAWNYTGAWDTAGAGIIDSAFTDCSQTAQDIYVNYVSTRKVGLIVKDACNTAIKVSNTVNLPNSLNLLSMPGKGSGNVFITGVVSAATGAVKNDLRIDGVNYLATNAPNNDIVQPNWGSNAGSGSFTIQALKDYNQPSSVKFGMKLNITGITNSFDPKTGAGANSFSMANAKLAELDYTTDQAGDSSPAVALSGTNCTMSNTGAKAVFVSGTPCTGGNSGDTNRWTVEVWGDYKCLGVSAGGNSSVTIQGSFDGLYLQVDSCYGGGGGGGGVVPVTF